MCGRYASTLPPDLLSSSLRAIMGTATNLQPTWNMAPTQLGAVVLALVAQGRSYRLIGREVGLSKNTVAEIIKRTRAASATNN